MSKEEIWEAISKDSEMLTFITSKIKVLQDTANGLKELTKKYEDLEKTYNELKQKESRLTEDYNKAKADLKGSTEKLSAYETHEAEAKRKEFILRKLEESKIKESFVPPAMLKLWISMEKEEELIESITDFTKYYDATYRESMGKVIIPPRDKSTPQNRPSYLEMNDEVLKKALFG